MDTKEINELIGLSLEEAEKKVSTPYFISPDYMDGQAMLKTRDVNYNRINVIVENNIITKIVDLR